MSCIKGQDLMIFLKGKSIALATNHTLEVNGDTIDCSTKDNGGGEWASNEIGLLSWSVSSENLIGDPHNGYGYGDLFALMVQKEPVDIVFGVKTISGTSNGDYYEVPNGGWSNNTAKTYFKGEAYITSLSINAPNGEHATMSVSFTGRGPLKKNDKTASENKPAKA